MSKCVSRRSALVAIPLLLLLLLVHIRPAAAFQDEARLLSRLTLQPPAEITVGDRPSLTVILNNAGGRPIPNKTIRIYINGERVRQARTEEDGRATIRIGSDLPVGYYTVRAEFPGTEAYRGAEATATLRVRPIQFEIETVPPLPQTGFELGGQRFYAGDDGVATLDVMAPGTYPLSLLPLDESLRPDTRIEFERWADSVFQPEREVTLTGDKRLQAGFGLSHRVTLDFRDLEGQPVAAARISTITIKSSHGAVYTFEDEQVGWLLANRIARRLTGLEVAPVQYAVESVMVDGTNVVNKYQQRFLAKPEDRWQIELLLYFARIHARDALFGTPVGNAVDLVYPDGRVEQLPFTPDQEVLAGPLARGLYHVQVRGVAGVAPETPVALSRDQEVELKVLTQANIAVGLLLGATLAFSLLFYGRPALLRIPILFLRRWRRFFPGAALLLLLLLPIRSTFAAPTAQPDPTRPVPLMAYYYIWYNTDSWDRAKSDYPLLGRYSSDDRQVMEQHVQWAQQAGIDGFIVSWKSTFQLDRRLETLMDVAAAADFPLWVLYQGLDFDRNPLPLERIDADLDYFVSRYAQHPAFAMYDRPVLIWSGTWGYSPQEVATIAASYGDRLLILASERSIDGYRRLADYVAGNAYYWSSVDPYGNDPLQQKLDAMAAAVHEAGGLWVAPAAPGFDAQLLGGTRVIPRQDGQTLRLELAAATRSSPDAIGLISWNEFSENSHVEPSEKYGTRALEVISDVQAGIPPQPLDFDSSAPGNTDPGNPYPFLILSTTLLFIGGSLAVVIVRNYRSQQEEAERTLTRSRVASNTQVSADALSRSARTISLLLIVAAGAGLLFFSMRVLGVLDEWDTAAAAALVEPDVVPPEAEVLPLAATPVPAAPPSARLLVLAPVAAGYVQAAFPDAPAQEPQQLRTDGEPLVRSYLRFDLSPVAGDILSATLRLYANSGSSVGYTVYDVANNDWAEETLTFATAPPLGPAHGISGPFAAGSWTSVDVTALLSHTEAGQVTLGLASTGPTNISFGSRMSGNMAPQLLVKTNTTTVTAGSTTPSTLPVLSSPTAPASEETSIPALMQQTPAVLLAAGDIATCSREDDEAVAALLDEHPGTVVALGDLAYESGSEEQFARCYGPSWGRHLARTRPVPGNHDYRTAGAAPYFDTFGPAAGALGRGYYSYTLGSWQVIALNSNCREVGGCDPASAQYQWLQQELAQNSALCTVAYWHHARWSSGEHGDSEVMDDIWRLLAQYGTDVVLAAHDHDYERFAPLNDAGGPDPAGIRSFVVGTGGKSQRNFAQISPFSATRNNDTFGILELRLGEGTYTWRFIPIDGGTFTDSGTGQCHP